MNTEFQTQRDTVVIFHGCIDLVPSNHCFAKVLDRLKETK